MVLSWSNYVALGDSLTAGRDDHGPDGGRIGWAQRLAGILSTRTEVPCALINLAADGARVATVLEQQLPPVGRLGPDLVSVTVGMNDISDPGFILDRFANQFGRLLDGLMLPGATVLTCTIPDIAGILPLPGGLVGLARQRIREASDTIREQAAARGFLCLDAWSMPAAADPGLFGPDRIHPNASGHQLMAALCADLLLGGSPPLLIRMPGVSGDLTRRWVAPVSYGVLAVELAVVTGFAAAYNALDFRIYMWGGHAVTHDTRLYLNLAYGHWFTYSPFAAVVFVPGAALPLALARTGWDLASVAALGYSLVLVLKLAGYRPSRAAIAGVTAAAMVLEPVYQTLFLGQVNLILLALILTDVWRVANRRNAGLGVGIAAAVKLTPAIFIVFFLLAGKVKPAVIAAATFLGCGLIGLIVAPGASEQYWAHLFYDTSRVGAPYISNQSPYAAAIRIADGAAHVGAWYVVIPVALGAVGLAAATILARHGDWLGAAAVTGCAGLLVSPISWAHHWIWILPALVVLVRSGHRVAAGLGYLLFAAAAFWYTPHSGGPREYGFHWLVTLVANCYLIAGLAFLVFMARRAYLTAEGRLAATRQPPPGTGPALSWPP